MCASGVVPPDGHVRDAEHAVVAVHQSGVLRAIVSTATSQ